MNKHLKPWKKIIRQLLYRPISKQALKIVIIDDENIFDVKYLKRVSSGRLSLDINKTKFLKANWTFKY